MNDFTKEELIEIKRCLKYMINGDITPYSNLTMNLNSLLQLMIQNYCEHQEEYEDLDYNPMRCKKCKEITG